LHALFGASTTGGGTFAAMLHPHLCMFLTFFRAFIADISAEPAKFFRPAASQAHQLSRRITNRSTFHIQLYTTGHHLYVLLLQTGGSTIITGSRTIQAGVNAFTVFMKIHNIYFKE
jgi:hypothetical protein